MRPRLQTIRIRATSLWRELSFTTRAILAGYGLYVAGAWTLGVAPGEIAFEGARTVAIEGELGRIRSVLRVGEHVLAVGLAPQGDRPAETAILDLRRGTDTLASTLVATAAGVGAPRSATLHDDDVDVLTADHAGGRHTVRVSLSNATAKAEALDPTALWLLPDGDFVGHGIEDWLVQMWFPTHIAATPAVVSGRLALLRVGAADGSTDAEGVWIVPPSASPDDFVIADAGSGEPQHVVDTVKLGPIVASPARSAFVVLEEGSPSFVTCSEAGCRSDLVHIRTDSYPIQAIDHADDLDRIAVCTPSELYLYEGEPDDDEVIFLGLAEIDVGCTSMAVIDGRTVLVAFEEGEAKLVRFSEEADA